MRTLIETLQFKQSVNRSGIGVIQNRYITIFPGNYGFSIVPYFTILLTEPPSNETINGLSKSLKNFKVVVSFEASTLIIIFNEPIVSLKPYAIDAMKNMLNKLIGLFNDYQLTQPQSCVYCHNPGYETYYYEHGVHHPAHEACLRTNLSNETKVTNQPIDSMSYVKSIVFMIVLGFIASIPSILSVIYLPLIYAILLVLVPLGNTVGFALGKGVVTQEAQRLIKLSGYLTGLIVIAWAWIFYAKAQNVSIWVYLSDSNHWIPFLFDCVVGGLFITLGLFFGSRRLPIRKL